MTDFIFMGQFCDSMWEDSLPFFILVSSHGRTFVSQVVHCPIMAMRRMSSVGFVCVLSMEDGEGLVDFHTEEPVQQHAALRDDCSSARSYDDCNNKGCCWNMRVPIYPICLPCGANDAVTGVAEQERGLALSQVLTSRPLKQYMEEPVQQHAALRDEGCSRATSESDCNNIGCCWGARWPIGLVCFQRQEFREGDACPSQEGTRSTFPTLV